MCSPHSHPTNLSPTSITDDGLHFHQQQDSQHLSSQPYGSNTFDNYSLSSANQTHFAPYQLHPENQGKNVLAAGADPDATFSQDLALLAYHSGLNDDQLRRGSTCSSTSSSFSAYTAASGSTSVPSDEAYGYFSDVSPVSTFTSDLEQPSQLYQKAFLTPNRGLGLLALHPGSPVQTQHHPHYQLQGQHYEHHTPSIARYACTFTDCSWATDRRDLVKDHVARCHAAIFTCAVEGCNKQFSQYASLEMHQIYHQFQRNQFMQTTVLDSAAHHHHSQPQSHLAHFPHAQASTAIGLGLVSDPFLDTLSPKQSFYPPPPPSLQAPFEYNVPTAALARRASESDIGIYVPPPSHTYNNSMSTLYEDDVYQHQQQTCSPPVTATRATFSSPTVADPHILSSSPQQIQQSLPLEQAPVGQAVIDPAYISPPHQVVHIQPLPIVTTSQYQSPPSVSPLPLVREDTLESYDGFSQECSTTSNDYLSPTPTTRPSLFDPNKANPIQSMHSSPKAPLGRAARINLTRRGSEASYFASHPRFASHPYFPVRPSATSSNYLSVAPSRIEGHPLQSTSGRTIYQDEEEYEEADIADNDDDDEEYSEQGKGSSQDARAETALMIAAAATRRGTTPALKELKTRRSVPVPPIVVNPNTKLHACDFEGCDRVFKRLEHKRRHERSHTQEKPYGCDVEGCGRFFSRSDNLTQHKRTHKKDGRTKRVTQANLSNRAKADSSDE